MRQRNKKWGEDYIKSERETFSQKVIFFLIFILLAIGIMITPLFLPFGFEIIFIIALFTSGKLGDFLIKALP